MNETKNNLQEIKKIKADVLAIQKGIENKTKAFYESKEMVDLQQQVQTKAMEFTAKFQQFFGIKTNQSTDFDLLLQLVEISLKAAKDTKNDSGLILP